MSLPLDPLAGGTVFKPPPEELPELLPEEAVGLLDRLELLSEEPESLLFAAFSFASASAFAFSSAAFFAASSAFRRSSSALMIAFSSSSSLASSEFCCLINALYAAASCFAFAICASKSFDWDFSHRSSAAWKPVPLPAHISAFPGRSFYLPNRSFSVQPLL